MPFVIPAVLITSHFSFSSKDVVHHFDCDEQRVWAYGISRTFNEKYFKQNIEKNQTKIQLIRRKLLLLYYMGGKDLELFESLYLAEDNYQQW